MNRYAQFFVSASNIAHDIKIYKKLFSTHPFFFQAHDEGTISSYCLSFIILIKFKLRSTVSWLRVTAEQSITWIALQKKRKPKWNL